MKKRTPEMVIEELRRRAAEGRSLKSGDNRGDWLYAVAVRFFGSWSSAVEAAGFDYEDIRTKPMTADEVREQLSALADEGDPLIASDHVRLHNYACQLFGSWKGAIEASGLELPDRRKWTPEKVIEAIRKEIEEGESMGTNDMRRRDENLYMAARRRFGTWEAALAAARSAVGAGSDSEMD